MVVRACVSVRSYVCVIDVQVWASVGGLKPDFPKGPLMQIMQKMRDNFVQLL